MCLLRCLQHIQSPQPLSSPRPLTSRPFALSWQRSGPDPILFTHYSSSSLILRHAHLEMQLADAGSNPLFKQQELAVVGGGDTAVEEALYLTKYGKKVCAP